MRTMEFSFHKVANYAAFFVFLCSVLLISGASTVQAENNAWVLDRVEYGTDQYTEWVVEAWGFKTEYSVSLVGVAIEIYDETYPDNHGRDRNIMARCGI